MLLGSLLSLALLMASAPLPVLAFDNESRFGPVVIRHGHGELIRRAAQHTPYASQVLPLIQAQWQLDLPGQVGPASPDDLPTLSFSTLWHGLVASYDGSEQKKHFMRWWSGLPAWRSQTHPMTEDYRDAVGYFQSELLAARACEPTPDVLAHLGHALHTLQDSYSPAHVHRSADGVIDALYYYPSPEPGHALLGDPRDRLVDDHGDLTPEAREALEASHALLLGYAAIRNLPPEETARFATTFERQYMPFRGN